jgi:hypothetical protein
VEVDEKAEALMMKKMTKRAAGEVAVESGGAHELGLESGTGTGNGNGNGLMDTGLMDTGNGIEELDVVKEGLDEVQKDEEGDGQEKKDGVKEILVEGGKNLSKDGDQELDMIQDESMDSSVDSVIVADAV